MLYHECYDLSLPLHLIGFRHYLILILHLIMFKHVPLPVFILHNIESGFIILLNHLVN